MNFWDKAKFMILGNRAGSDGMTPLEKACRFGDMDALSFYKRHGVKEVLKNGYHILDYAHPSSIKKMLEMGYGSSLSVEKKKDILRSSMINSAHSLTEENIKFCRSMGISMGETDSKGNNVFLKKDRLTPEELQTWIKAAHINQVGAEFLASAVRGDVARLDSILKSKKIALETTIDGKTAMYKALTTGQKKSALLLAEQGAKIDVVDHEGKSALDTAQGKSLMPDLLKVAAQKGNIEQVQDLAKAGVSFKDDSLMLAAARNDKMMDLLHEHGAPCGKALDFMKTIIDRLDRRETISNPNEEKRMRERYNKMLKFFQEDKEKLATAPTQKMQRPAGLDR